MQYGRKVKHSATECSENESPLKEIHVDHVLRDVAEQHYTASGPAFPKPTFTELTKAPHHYSQIALH